MKITCFECKHFYNHSLYPSGEIYSLCASIIHKSNIGHPVNVPLIIDSDTDNCPDWVSGVNLNMIEV